MPAAAILLTAHQELEKLVGTIHQNQFKPEPRPAVGLPRLRRALVGAAAHRPRRLHGRGQRPGDRARSACKLYKGSVRVVTRSSPNAVYDADLASFAESGGLFSQAASPGFIELWSLQSRMAHRIRQRGEEEELMTTTGSARPRSASRSRYLRRRYRRQIRIGAGVAVVAIGDRRLPGEPQRPRGLASPATARFRCGLSSTCEGSLTNSATLAASWREHRDKGR